MRFIMQDLGGRRLQSEVAVVAVEAGVIGKALRVAAEIDLVVGLMEIAVAQNEFRFAAALKPCARHNVEDAISAVAMLGRVAAALQFQIINIFGIVLGTDIAGYVGSGR